jgi:hypothetical protein
MHAGLSMPGHPQGDPQPKAKKDTQISHSKK